MTQTIELPINVYDMMRKYKHENRSFMSFMKGLSAKADIWGWINYPKYGCKEELLMQAWLDFNFVKIVDVYFVKLPHLVTSDGKPQYLSQKDLTFFASRRDKDVQQHFSLDQIPQEYLPYAIAGSIELEDMKG